jgi:ferredoxin
MSSPVDEPGLARLERQGLSALLEALWGDGYTVMGPVVRDEAIVYDEVRVAEDLPVGWTEDQEAGRYRLRRRDDAAVFGFVVGPQSWKRFLFPPEVRLWRARRDGGSLTFETEPAAPPRYAFLGVRSCELAAIAIQDKVFLESGEADPVYRARREGLLLIAVNCGVVGGTCFCTSMGTGPRAKAGFDLALTEVMGDDHHFVVEAGSERGTALLERLPTRAATPAETQAADEVTQQAAQSMGRSLNTDGLPQLLRETLDHPRWDDVAARCMTCANCTMVCPTCFCSSVEDVSDVTGEHAERWRRWDSCFSVDFSYIHGGSVRPSPRARYRQWMTHKLSSWWEQFDTSGCVGCGRCVTWCPVGIDITEEARAIRDSVEGVP